MRVINDSASQMRRAQIPQGGRVPTNPRNITKLGTGQILVSTTPQQISYVDPNRAAIKLTNLSATTEIFYGHDIGVTATSGDLVPAGRGQWVSVPGGSAIFVVVASGTAQMSWAEVFD